jgi:hypothetical protein
VPRWAPGRRLTSAQLPAAGRRVVAARLLCGGPCASCSSAHAPCCTCVLSLTRPASSDAASHSVHVSAD